MTSNEEFLHAIFGDQYEKAHVTSFSSDPNQATRYDWVGDRYKNIQINPGNQYFTISLFSEDENGKARRRKANYLATYCIVLDDVKEKLAIEQAKKLPEPAWILETSAGSEQWGYILTTPCTDRARVENLLDGLVENGLAPNGKDPGMKGVTRYVRLPEGINNKHSKCINGIPFNCRLLLWEPDRRCSISELAAPFYVDLDKPRRDERIDGAALVPDHPLLNCELIKIREMRSNGRYDISCPWHDEHTGGVDNGAGIFTNHDGTYGFKCHHGACEHRTARDLTKYIDSKIPGWSINLKSWVIARSFSDITERNKNNQSAPAQKKQEGNGVITLNSMIDSLMTLVPDSPEQLEMAQLAIDNICELSSVEQVTYKKRIRETMRWSDRELNAVIKESEIRRKRNKNGDIDFLSGEDVIYVAEQNQFFDRKKRLWLTPDAYQNKYSHLDEQAKKNALNGGRVMKVDKIDYAPKMPPIYKNEDDATIGNAWHRDNEIEGKEGDCSLWLEHFDLLGWGEYRDHVLKWMAYTIRHPEQKINHMIIFGGLEGSGKDWLLRPLTMAMGCNATTISGEELLEGFNEHILNTKYLHVNEMELGDRKDASMIANKLKPLAAAPPEKLRVNQKGVKKIEVTNLLSVTATTNSKLPFNLHGQSRRIFALWSDLNVRNSKGEMLQEWREYWRNAWGWMDDQEGIQHCIWYLRNVVDISDFYPREAPPVTSFLQEIVTRSNVVSFL